VEIGTNQNRDDPVLNSDGERMATPSRRGFGRASGSGEDVLRCAGEASVGAKLWDAARRKREGRVPWPLLRQRTLTVT